MALPANMRQFDMSTLLTATITVAVSAFLYKAAPVQPLFFLVTITSFWIGMTLMVFSDAIDPESPNEKRPLGFLLNTIGILITPTSFIAWFGLLFINLCHVLAGLSQ